MNGLATGDFTLITDHRASVNGRRNTESTGTRSILMGRDKFFL